MEEGKISDVKSSDRNEPLPPETIDGFSTLAALQALSEPVYATDCQGRLTSFNRSATEIWGVTPELGTREFDGLWKLLNADGSVMEQEESPIALVLRSQSVIRGFEALGERADGRRIRFLAFASPRLDRAGRLIGAVNLLIKLSDPSAGPRATQRLAALIESSEDAIIAKDVNGVITDWNAGAMRLFGYTAEEAIGQPVAMLIPPDRHDEEPDILGRLSRGEHIDHYDTVRQRKDGSLVAISLSVSPIKNSAGEVIGGSNIARDITARRSAEEQKTLLLGEMNHRIKNLFTLAGSIVTLSARSAATPDELATAVLARLGALARAQSLTLPQITEAGAQVEHHATLKSLMETILAPYQGEHHARIQVSCCDFHVKRESVTSFALLVNEFATNAAKYGSLSTPQGRVEIHCAEHGGDVLMQWQEIGGPASAPPTTDGFGSRLVQTTVNGQFSGQITREWTSVGLVIKLTIPASRIRAV